WKVERFRQNWVTHRTNIGTGLRGRVGEAVKGLARRWPLSIRTRLWIFISGQWKDLQPIDQAVRQIEATLICNSNSLFFTALRCDVFCVTLIGPTSINITD